MILWGSDVSAEVFSEKPCYYFVFLHFYLDFFAWIIFYSGFYFCTILSLVTNSLHRSGLFIRILTPRFCSCTFSKFLSSKLFINFIANENRCVQYVLQDSCCCLFTIFEIMCVCVCNLSV